MGYPIHATLSSLEQVRMHGPEAASIMRNELNYAGTIIGRRRQEIVLVLMIVIIINNLNVLFELNRYYG